MFVDKALDRFGNWLARLLSKESGDYHQFTVSDPETLKQSLQPCDIILIEGHQKIAVAIQYLTQPTWSPAAIYVAGPLGPGRPGAGVTGSARMR